MSERARTFVELWVEKNVDGELSAELGADTRPAEYARDCFMDAKNFGISRGEIEDEFGSLVSYIWQTIDLAPMR